MLCSKFRPCRCWRTCPACGRARQARIASQVETLRDVVGALQWSIIYGCHSIESARFALAQFRQTFAIRAAVWTLEHSRSMRVHVNVLHEVNEGVAAWCDAYHVWSSPIVGEIRNVGAYIGKASQAVPRESMQGGHSSGAWGITNEVNWRKFSERTAQPLRGHAVAFRTASVLLQSSESYRLQPEIALAARAVSAGVDVSDIRQGIELGEGEIIQPDSFVRAPAPRFAHKWRSCDCFIFKAGSRERVAALNRKQVRLIARRWLVVVRKMLNK